MHSQRRLLLQLGGAASAAALARSRGGERQGDWRGGDGRCIGEFRDGLGRATPAGDREGAASAGAPWRLGSRRPPLAARCEVAAERPLVASAPGPPSTASAAVGSKATGKRAICVGAGAAGLACAKELLERGFEVVVLEAREGIGGVWRFDGSGSHVGVRVGQRATSSKYYLGFSDFPFPDDAQDFVSHEAYLAYLEAYAKRFGVAERIRFKSSVEAIRKAGDGPWEVEISSSGRREVLFCDSVAVCSGLHRRPTAASAALAPGEFSGRVVHSRDLKDAWESLRGQRIVVVGGGETGAELAHVAASVGAGPALLSLRRGITTIGPYLPLPLLGRTPDARTPPVDLNERRLVSLLPEAAKSFIFTQRGVFELREDNPGKHSLARVLLALMGAGLGVVESLLYGLNAIGGAASEIASTVASKDFWNPAAAPFRPADGGELAAKMKQSLASLALDGPRPMQRDLSQLEDYSRRAAEFRLRGFTAAHYREVRSLLEEYSGARHTGNFLTKSDDFIYDLLQGSLELRPAVSGFRGREVHFEDGSCAEADVVVCCTGYEPAVPFVRDPHLRLGEHGELDPAGQLYKRVFAPGCGPSLGFIGFARPQIGAMPPIAELQARWFAAVQAGEVSLPSADEMEAAVDADSRAYESKVFAHRLRASVDFAKYTKEVACLAGCYPEVGLTAFLSSNLLWRAFWLGPVLPQAYRLGDGGERGEAARSYMERVYLTFFTRS